MNHFNFKSLAFYGVAIGSVVILFKVVSTYGEANLKAPPAIGGNYLIDTKNLPECLKADKLVLNIDQSGIYLFSSLVSVKENVPETKSADAAPSLHGLLNGQNLNLEGTIPHLAGCPNGTHSPEASGQTRPLIVKIVGQVEKKAITGEIILSFSPEAAKFTAQLETPTALTKKSH